MGQQIRWRRMLVISTLCLYLINVAINVGWAEESSPIVYPTYPQPNYGEDAKRDLIIKGEYLTKMGDCISCHTNTKEGGKPFAGGLGLKTPFGTFYSPNITADPETGIGKWSDKDFIHAMQSGIAPNGSHYFPVFPYPSFTKVSANDALAIKAYLFSIPAVKQVPRKNDVPFPFNWRFLQLGWKLLFFYGHKGPYQYDPTQSPQWNQGAYIVQGLGHCGECHSPRNAFGAVKHDYALTGAFVDGYYAPDITSTGLHGVSDQEVIEVFTKGKMFRGAGQVQGPMAEVNYNSLRYMTPQDLQAIVTYLRTVKSKVPPTAAKTAPGEITAETGKNIYNANCSICHDSGAAGAPKVGDVAAWEPRLKLGMPMIIQHAINGYNSMPPKGTCMSCSNEEIKAAVEYMLDNSKEGASDNSSFSKPSFSYQPVKLTVTEARNVYINNCSVCHDDGKMGAPKIGDKDRWAPLLKQSMDSLIAGTLTSHARIPGIRCSDKEILAAIKYMVQESKINGDYSLW